MRKKSLALLVAVVSVLMLAAAPVSAQSASTLRDELLKDWLDMQTTLNALASVMPEDRYTFKTTPPQRDFAQQILHVANANVVNLKFLGGSVQAPAIDRAARTKADVLRAMNASFDYGAAVIRSQTEASLFEVVPTNAFLGPSSRARVLYFLLGHSWDVYGQLVVYVRLNGGVPPASDRP
jgi:hypothetical protein